MVNHTEEFKMLHLSIPAASLHFAVSSAFARVIPAAFANRIVVESTEHRDSFASANVESTVLWARTSAVASSRTSILRMTVVQRRLHQC